MVIVGYGRKGRENEIKMKEYGEENVRVEISEG